MENLIEALRIFVKYDNPKYPTHCEHDVLYILISPTKIKDDDIKILCILGFEADLEEDCFFSFKYGSA